MKIDRERRDVSQYLQDSRFRMGCAVISNPTVGCHCGRLHARERRRIFHAGATCNVLCPRVSSPKRGQIILRETGFVEAALAAYNASPLNTNNDRQLPNLYEDFSIAFGQAQSCGAGVQALWTRTSPRVVSGLSDSHCRARRVFCDHRHHLGRSCRQLALQRDYAH